MSISTARLDRDTEERFVRLRAELGVTSFGVNQMVLLPGQRGRIHRHREQEEVYLVLAGTLTLVVEGEEHEVGPDELVRVSAQDRRQLVNRGPEKLLMLALGGHGEHVGRDAEAFESWDDQDGRPPRDVPLPEDVPVG